MRNINKLFATTAFIILLPLIAIELMIKRPDDFVAQIKLSFQVMLFVVNLGSQK